MIKKRFRPSSMPIAILLLSIAAYGLLIPWMGFYWDDWTFAWISHFLGPQEFVAAFKPFRPFLGPIFTFTTSLFHETPILWQVFALLLRALTGIALWWSAGKIWPKNRRETAVVALCFVVFPGYLSQWVALTHSNQELISLLAYLLSFGVTAVAVRQRNRALPLTLAALALTFVGLFPTEYFIGLELLRPIFLWFMLETSQPSLRKRAIGALRLWAPYLALWALNGAWLYFYRSYGAYDSYGIKVFGVLQLPLAKLLVTMLEEIIKAIATAGFSAWAQPFSLLLQPLGALANLLALGLAAVCFILTAVFLARTDDPETTQEKGETPWAVQAILLGILAILAGRLPSWIAGLPLDLQFSWDRFMLSMMLGGSLLMVGLVEFLVKTGLRKTVLFSLLIALAVGRQFSAANTFRRDWENQRQFFWQLSWRIPALKPGTMLVTHELPLVYETDFNLTAPLNWIYSPTIQDRTLPYMLVYTRARLGSDLLPRLESGQSVEYPYRTVTFRGSTSDMVVFYHPVPGCARVLDPLYSSGETVPGATYMLTDAIPLSNLSRIDPLATPAQPPSSLFGKEPQRSWCYYFEKAELARQEENWVSVAQLGDEAARQGFAASTPVEWLPFIEGYARTGNLEKAASLTQKVHEAGKDLSPALCSLWTRAASQDPADRDLQAAAGEWRASLKCAQ